LIGVAQHVFHFPAAKPQAPPGWEKTKDSWWTRLISKKTRQQILERYDTRPASEIAAEKHSILPVPAHVSNTELGALISGGLADLKVEEVVRRLYWRYLNEPIRETHRKFRETNKEVDAAGNSSTFPDFQPTPEQAENMLRLIDLIKASDAPDWLEMAELHHELGDVGAASSALTCVVSEQNRLHHLFEKLIALNARCPVRLKY
jgi:hypothetical protein